MANDVYGVWSQGTKLVLNSDNVSNITNITGPSISVDEVDVSSFDSGKFREFKPGLADAGELSVEGNHVDKSAVDLWIDAVDDGTIFEDAELKVPDGSGNYVVYTFNCFVQEYEAEADFEDKATFSASLKITGGVSVSEEAITE